MTAEEFKKFIYRRIDPPIKTDVLLSAKLYIEQLEALLFMPYGDTHHNANICKFCQENLNGKT